MRVAGLLKKRMPPYSQNPDMTNLSGNEREQYVQEMFTKIAPRYDLINTLITFGQDRLWRQEVIKRANLPPGGSVLLDLGAGTGDLGFEAIRQNPATTSIEADFTIEMMRFGQERVTSKAHETKGIPTPIHWSAADAHQLPFPEDSFDAVVSGFLLRNVTNLPQVLREQRRVLKAGGRVVTLDTTRPKQNIFSPIIRFHMHVIIPALGRLLTGNADAYKYLPDTSERFLSAEELTAHLAAVGFQQILFRRLNFGTIAIHWGTK